VAGKRQDPVNFSQFVSDRQRGLLRLATALTGDPRHAEDIVGDVLARAYERWHRISQLDRSNAYVRAMVVNEFVTRQRRWRRATPVADLADIAGATPDHAAVHAERAALISELQKLPRRQRAVLVLRYYEGLPDREIAAVLDCAAGTVRSLISRALAALRIEMAEPGPGHCHPHVPLLTAEET
jgi:RNA polymerase sigma-70 factor (sigma-E family)